MQLTPFIQIIRIALGRMTPESFVACDDDTWDTIFEKAKRQAVIGLLYQGMMKLPEEKKPKAKIKVKIAVVAEKIQMLNKKVSSCTVSLYNDLCELGFAACVLKGQGTALYYDDPTLRQCGDIDIWVGGERKEILKKLGKRWKTEKVFYHHVDVDVFNKSPEVEIHFTPSWMNNPFVNRKLQRYFKSCESSQLGRMVEGVDFAVPDMTFNLVFNMAHIYRHLLFEGVGMRQLVDYYYLLMNSDEQQRKSAAALLPQLHMERFASAISYVMREIFDMDESLLLALPSQKYGEQLLCEIFTGGNFGKYDPRNKNVGIGSAPVRFARRMNRLVRFVFAYPSEVLWAPYFKIKQYLFISR